MSEPERFQGVDEPRLIKRSKILGVNPEMRVRAAIAAKIEEVCIDNSPHFDPKEDPITKQFLGIIGCSHGGDLKLGPIPSDEEFPQFLKRTVAQMRESGDKHKGEDGFKGLPDGVILFARKVVKTLIYHEYTGYPLEQLPDIFLKPDRVFPYFEYWKKEGLWNFVVAAFKRHFIRLNMAV